MRVRSENDGRNGVRRFIELDEDDARFVLDELSASCPGDGFTRDLYSAVDEAWPAKCSDDVEDDEWVSRLRVVLAEVEWEPYEPGSPDPILGMIERHRAEIARRHEGGV